MNGKFIGIAQGEKHTFKISELRLLHGGNYQLLVNNAPEGMDFYDIDPSTTMAATHIGISQDKVAIWSSQTAYANYPQDVASGYITEYKISDLEKQGIPKAQVNAVASKIVLGNNESQPIIRLD
ncbi:hypothetical protein ACEE96_05055 [Staphylococcus simulans]